MANETDAVRLARLEERMKVQEAKTSGIEMKLWGAVVLIVATVASKILGLLEFGGGGP